MDVVGYVQRLWGVHMDMVRNRGSKGMDRCPLTEAAAVAIVVELLTISKGKRKVAPAKAKVFSEVDGLVSHSVKVVINMQLTHSAHSVTSASRGRRSQSALLRLMSGSAESARWTRAGAPGEGRVARSSRVK
jgi:hypothetical protein